ncbi:MAG: TlpA disulfide reductase family protein [Salibacteraceae bacterium]|nr:TlpA disulfide reductase family protein [Salibacteraceae bacterium]|tara:strand:- start:5142 stop:6347 length:1206 start_codon:yes stop_codon:yes gene_type:complete
MALKKLVYLILVFSVTLNCTSKKTVEISQKWKGALLLSPEVRLPIIFELNFKTGDSTFMLINGSERLTYKIQSGNNNDFKVKLEPYNSELNFTISASNIQGTWTNYAKSTDYKISFEASESVEKKSINEQGSTLKFQIQFGVGKDAYPAILLLKKENKSLSGTIKTETGDYRYLSGKQEGDSIWMACFDGAHAFLFTALQKGDSLTNGSFYSGNHYKDIWQARINESFDLTDPTELTKITSDTLFRFSLMNQNGALIDQTNPIFNNTVTCIQIMGTWCPNCKDETEFLKEIRAKYTEIELQIVAAAFEYEKDTTKVLARIKHYSNSMKLNYPIYYGGSTNKKKVTDVFPDLDRVISYPTLIILDKAGKVKQVHTGFNGPATDEYLEFKKSTIRLIDSLIII